MESRAIVMRSYGAPDVLKMERVELSPLRPDEVRIQTLASAINHSDLEIRAGNWPVLKPEPFPYVPGLEVVGDVVEVGAEVRGVRVGDRVTTMMMGLGGVRAERSGGYAEHVTVRGENTAVVPATIDPIALAAVGLAGVTAYGGLAMLGDRVSRRIVITGAAGGVGSAALALAKARGAQVVAVVSREEQRAYAARLGGGEVVVARDGGALAKAVSWRSADAVLDAVAGPLFPALIAALKPGGALCLVGAVGGGDVRFDAWALLLPLTLCGYSTESLDGPALRNAIESITAAMTSGALEAPATTVMHLDEAARAHALLEAHGVSGRIVLTP